jgi:hypothetical protein
VAYAYVSVEYDGIYEIPEHFHLEITGANGAIVHEIYDDFYGTIVDPRVNLVVDNVNADFEADQGVGDGRIARQ